MALVDELETQLAASRATAANLLDALVAELTSQGLTDADTSQQPPFDHEATLEELAGVGKNRRFDAVIDDEEFEDIQVICKRGDEEIPLAKPSRAFYFGDRNLYDQEAKRFDQEEKARILNTDQFPRNLTRFDELKRSCQRGFVIPFVGAGMSKGAGCPEWKRIPPQVSAEMRNSTARPSGFGWKRAATTRG